MGRRVTDIGWRRSRILDAEGAGCRVTDLWVDGWFGVVGEGFAVFGWKEFWVVLALWGKDLQCSDGRSFGCRMWRIWSDCLVGTGCETRTVLISRALYRVGCIRKVGPIALQPNPIAHLPRNGDVILDRKSERNNQACDQRQPRWRREKGTPVKYLHCNGKCADNIRQCLCTRGFRHDWSPPAV